MTLGTVILTPECIFLIDTPETPYSCIQAGMYIRRPLVLIYTPACIQGDSGLLIYTPACIFLKNTPETSYLCIQAGVYIRRPPSPYLYARRRVYKETRVSLYTRRRVNNATQCLLHHNISTKFTFAIAPVSSQVTFTWRKRRTQYASVRPLR